MINLGELVDRLGVKLKTSKRYTGPALLVAAKSTDHEVVVVREPKPPAGPMTSTQTLDRDALKEQLSEYHGSIITIADLVDTKSEVFELWREKDEAACYRIGRELDNEFVLHGSGVSGKHAELRYVQGRWILRDLDSRNGTYVNKRVLQPGEEVPVVNCDCVRFGDCVYYFLAGQYLFHFFVHILDNPPHKSGG